MCFFPLYLVLLLSRHKDWFVFLCTKVQTGFKAGILITVTFSQVGFFQHPLLLRAFQAVHVQGMIMPTNSRLSVWDSWARCCWLLCPAMRSPSGYHTRHEMALFDISVSPTASTRAHGYFNSAKCILTSHPGVLFSLPQHKASAHSGVNCNRKDV